MSDHVEIQITCGTDAEADALALALVDRRLAACVQRLPIRSTYRWRGAVERDDEVLLLVKPAARGTATSSGRCASCTRTTCPRSPASRS